MKIITFSLGAVIALLIVLLATASIFNFRNDRKPEAKEFLDGKLPHLSLDGDYSGTQFKGLGDKWLGKHFSARDKSGINNFSSTTDVAKIEQRYPFNTSQVPSLRNKKQTVFQLDYNTAKNPFWMKLIRDELVEVSPNNYLGKIQLKFGFLIVTLDYFRLSN